MFNSECRYSERRICGLFSKSEKRIKQIRKVNTTNKAAKITIPNLQSEPFTYFKSLVN